MSPTPATARAPTASSAARDPQSWAKDAIARALRALGHRDPAPYLRGLHHVQLEPVWNAFVDTAPNLRCACAQALVDTDLAATEALRELIPLLVDPFAVVRAEAVAAVSQTGGHDAVLLLRLKAHVGDEEPAVLGACFAAIVEREPDAALAFVTPFLDHRDDAVAAEAAAALALSRDPDALDAVRAFLERTPSGVVREAVVVACAGSPQPGIVDVLLAIVDGRDRALAEHAVRAIASSRFRASASDRARAAVERTRDRRLADVYADAFA